MLVCGWISGGRVCHAESGSEFLTHNSEIQSLLRDNTNFADPQS